MAGRHLTVAGERLYAETGGAGDPVLLLHGGFCSLEPLRPQAESLAADFQVHAYERPGHGRSPDTDGPYDYAAWTAQATAYLDARGIDAAHVVGFSDGAVIGLLLALEHPQRVRSLVAISGNLDPTAFRWAVPAPVDVDRRPEHDEPDAGREREVYGRLSPDGAEHADVVLAKLVQLWSTEPHIDPADLARIQAPTLIISGDRDTIRPDHSLLIADRIPGAQLCILPDATHDLVTEHRDLLTVLVRTFLRSQPRPEQPPPRHG